MHNKSEEVNIMHTRVNGTLTIELVDSNTAGILLST